MRSCAHDLVSNFFQQEVECLGLLTIVCNADTGTGNNLTSIALSIHFAKASPLTEQSVVLDIHERDAVLGAQSLNELFVCWLVAVVCEEAEVHLLFVKHLGPLANATCPNHCGTEAFFSTRF